MEIKFRAWSESRNRMIFWGKLIEMNLSNILSGISGMKIMQYTGLHDKNKKDIYDGDIIKYKDKTDNGIGLVRFHEARYEVVWIDKSYLRKDLYFWAKKREIEIIGNIYENPELIERED